MSRIRKKDLLEIVKQLQDVNEQIDKKGSLIDGLDLAECQELAAKLGEFIENKYSGEDLVESVNTIIHGLEDYCEFIYRMSLAENLSDVNKLHKLSKKIRLTLVNVSNALKNDLPSDRKQVVFLPYKASMWDSLESIWMEAHKDPEVDDFVIPIPYFDRNPDGTFAEMHYEGDQYPDYVPITDWQKYSIPDEKPDVIFIHNPYDDCNYVTSVHPAFYSRELKKWTECLVYVPYFVLDGTYIGKEMTTAPACFNADYIVCLNEYEEKRYIEDISECLNHKSIRPKLLPYGSPKFDAMRNLSDDYVKIPDEWKDVVALKKPEYIVFYNSSVGSLLRADVDSYLNSFIDIVNVCNQNSILVIWRPHPLMEATLKSMRGSYYEKYKGIKKQFIEKHIGILDETSDMHTVMFLSDIYLGDISSLMPLYVSTGKPVIIFEEVRGRALIYKNATNNKNNRILKKVCRIIDKEQIEWEMSFSLGIIDSGKVIYKRVLSE